MPFVNFCRLFFKYRRLALFFLNKRGLVEFLSEKTAIPGHEIAPNTVANATKIIVLATKIQKSVAKLATRTL
mgnify:CR=1 FL=1